MKKKNIIKSHFEAKITVLIFLIILIITNIAFLRKANAQLSSQTVTISPPSLKFILNPGDSTEGKLSVINDSDGDLNFIARVDDFIVTDDNGTPQLLPPGTLNNNRYSASNWIAPAPDQFTVKAHQRFDFNYYVKVPNNAAPGGHYAAIVYQPVTPNNQQSSGAHIQTQIATLVYLTVSGPVNEFAKVTSFSAPLFQEYGPVVISSQIKNFGDVHITPKGEIKVKNLLGQIVYTTELNQRNIFPGNTALNYTNTLGNKFMIGKFTATLLGSYGVNNNLPLTATVTFYVFPWRISLVIILIVIIIILIILILKKKSKTKNNSNHEENNKTDQPPTLENQN